MDEKRLQTSESLFLAALLAIVGGFLDAYSYLLRGGVFANAQTGNIALLGVYIQRRNGSMIIHYLVPILAFAAGVVSGLLEGLSLEEAIYRGNAMGAIIITSKGDNDILPVKGELERFMKDAR